MSSCSTPRYCDQNIAPRDYTTGGLQGKKGNLDNFKTEYFPKPQNQSICDYSMSVAKNLWLFWLPCFLSGNGLAYVYEEYSNSYNEISDGEQQQMGATSNPCQIREQTQWDKLFIMLENSNMMQNMLLQHSEDLMKVLHNEIHKLCSDNTKACVKAIQQTCKNTDKQVNLKLDHAVGQLREVAEKHQVQNSLTLQQLVEMIEDQATRLVRLESIYMQAPGLAQVSMKHFPVYSKVQGTTSRDVRKLEKALKAVASNLDRVHTQLAYFQYLTTHRHIPSGCEMALLFPMRSKHSFAEVMPSTSLALSSLSICLWVKVIERLNRTILFSYGTEVSPHELQLLLAHNSLLFVVAGEMHYVEASNTVSDEQWGHYCGIWSSEQGLASLWVNGEKVASVSGVAEGHHLPDGGSIFLGQERRHTEMHRDIDPSVGFTGKMTALNMWDHTLEVEAIKQYANRDGACEMRGNVIGWGVTEIIPQGGALYIN